MRPSEEVQAKRDDVRKWAEKHNIPVKDRGRFPNALVAAFEADDPKAYTEPQAPTSNATDAPKARPEPEHGTDARYQRGCHTATECPGNPETGVTGLTTHRAKNREAARQRRERLRALRAAEAPAHAQPDDEPQEPETPASESRAAVDEGLSVAQLRADLDEATRRAEAAESALALALAKWDGAVLALEDANQTADVFRVRIRGLEGRIVILAADAEQREQVIRDLDHEARGHLDAIWKIRVQLRALRDDNDRLRRPWWKRASA